MITQKAIATELKISQKTVSRVINGSMEVKEETRDKVMRLLRQKNYRPNVNARNLCTRRTGAIGVLLSDPGAFSSFYFLQSFKGINEYIGERDYHLFFVVLDNRQRIDEIYQQSDGFIIFDISGIGKFVPEMSKTLKAMKKELVFIQSINRGRRPYVTIDNEYGGYQATRYLLKSGHRRIAFFGYGSGSTECHCRAAGYRKALRETGCKVNNNLLFSWQQPNELKLIFQRFMAMPAGQRPTAIFCWSDRDARILIYECELRGIKVPEELSIIGFDDNPAYSLMASPQLTTMRQPFYELGRSAAKMLFDSIHKQKRQSNKLLIKPELIERESCMEIV